MTGLRLQVVTVRATRPLFSPLSVTIAPGEVLTVMGPSGVGKSSLIAYIGGHLSAGLTGIGRVTLDGADITDRPPEARRIGVMFQEATLFPHLSVGDNLAFGLAARIRGRAARLAAVEAALVQAGLGGLGPRDPDTLSGGQRTRAALMRTLLAEPRALLLDEPFAALDTVTRGEIRDVVLSHLRAQGIPVLMVTHDPDDAAAAQGRILRLDQPSE